MNEFCRLKGIKREFSVAKTPQQNRVAERKNMTLIEAARTMLADSLLLTVFWAEVVNIACYVLNKVLVAKPHNKTPYELIIGRPPSISFMRPFGCPVTILNTLDPLANLMGRLKKGQGPNWLFDIDSLINSMKYQPITARNQTNKNASPQEANGDTDLNKSIDARQSKEKNVSTDDAASETHIQKLVSENEQALKNILNNMMDQEKEDTEQSDDVRKEFEAQCNRELFQGKATRASNTNSFNSVSTPVNAASAPKTSNDVNDFPDDPLMPDLEDIAEVQNTGIFGSAFDDEDLDTYNSPFADQFSFCFNCCQSYSHNHSTLYSS
ncbi:putative ribonuclease H-like domain-containing protein [Tanacetum coccineum]|uniref:Ribonuclease H-like domain-containing protein n=1 Tax=Tanacetum coccineum TaxID=301880 RepID=A0ABQ5C614_9ASTR